MIKLKTAEEIELMRQAALVVSKTLGEIAKVIKPGVTGLELDKIAEECIRDHGAIPAFLGQYDFPNTLCISPNEQVVHGIPTNVPFKDGDIVSVDCGSILNGYFGDHAYTFPIGEVKPEVMQLLRVTKESLYKGIEATNTSNRISDIGFAVQQHAEAHGYGVVRELVGHGLGTQLHEEPQVPNYGKRGRGKRIKNGLTIAIEPMINMGTEKIKQHADGWTITTGDGLPSAHFEHDVAVINGKAEILSTFSYIEEVLGVL
ncbi:MAG: type I methionyl aminopeptidase [Crocinitomicaceae bacterium]|nr:type I methionyl aminopeptidase [Crocinitomicaceae bacterium]